MNACSYIHEHDGGLRVITKYLDDVIHDSLTEIPIHHSYSSSLLLVVLWFSLFVLLGSLSVCNRYTHPSRYCSGTVTLIRVKRIR